MVSMLDLLEVPDFLAWTILQACRKPAVSRAPLCASSQAFPTHSGFTSVRFLALR